MKPRPWWRRYRLGVDLDARDRDFAAARLAVADELTRRKATAALLDGAMHSVWLHGNWTWLTQKMSTEEREAACDAVERYSATGYDDGEDPLRLDRWWRDDYRPATEVRKGR